MTEPDEPNSSGTLCHDMISARTCGLLTNLIFLSAVLTIYSIIVIHYKSPLCVGGENQLSRGVEPGGGGKVAVTVMPQYHESLGAVLQNVHSVAPEEWKIQLFISKENQTRVEALPLVKHLREKGRQVIITPTISYDMSYPEYSTLFKTKDFWDQMQGK